MSTQRQSVCFLFDWYFWKRMKRSNENLKNENLIVGVSFLEYLSLLEISNLGIQNKQKHEFPIIRDVCGKAQKETHTFAYLHWPPTRYDNRRRYNFNVTWIWSSRRTIDKHMYEKKKRCIGDVVNVVIQYSCLYIYPSLISLILSLSVLVRDSDAH